MEKNKHSCTNCQKEHQEREKVHTDFYSSTLHDTRGMERLNDGRVDEDSVRRRRLGIRGDGEGNVAYLPRRRKEKRVDCNGGEKRGGGSFYLPAAFVSLPAAVPRNPIMCSVSDFFIFFFLDFVQYLNGFRPA